MRTDPKFRPRGGAELAWQLQPALLVMLLFCGYMGFSQAPALGPAAAQAIQAQNAGNKSNALRLYSEALEQSPGWTEGWWRYGGLLYESKQYATAEQAFGRLTQLAPDNSLGFALLGLCEFEQGDWNNASLHLNKALNHGNLPVGIAQVSTFDLGLVHLRLNNRDGAIMAFKLLLHQAPDYPDLALALGAAELNLSSLPHVQDSQFAPALLAGKAAVAVLKDQPPEAEKLYRKLIAEYPQQPYAHLCLGLFFEGEHRDNEAASELAAETKLNPNSADAWLWLARVALVQNDPATARSAAARAQALDPDNPVVFLVLGRSYILEHRWEEALPPLQEAEKRAPQSPEIHFALASAYTALHRSEAAKLERQLFLQLSGSDGSGEGSAAQ
jgi:tetratricopeptide (TPR) repeat protein